MEWFWNSLNWLMDLFSSWGWDISKKATIVVLGLDNAGKTTMISRITTGAVRTFPPTIHPVMEETRVGGLSIKAWDLGGHASARSVWDNYSLVADAIVYIVDAHEKARFEESKTALNILLTDPKLMHVPILVFGNKIDLFGTVSEEEFREVMNLSYSVTTGKDVKVQPGQRGVEVFMSSSINSFGIEPGFKWLAKQL